MPRKHKPTDNKSGSLQPLRVVRQSGLPVLPQHLKSYETEYRLTFDKIQSKLGVTDSSILTQEQAERFTKLLNRCDRLLLRYYPVVQEWPFLTYTQYKKKITEYDCNILITMEKTTGHLCYILMDEDRAMERAREEQETQMAGIGYNKLKDEF